MDAPMTTPRYDLAVKGRPASLRVLERLIGVLKAIVRAGDARFLFLFVLSGLLFASGPSRLFKTLDRLGVTSVYGRVVTGDNSRFVIDFRGLILVYEIYLLNCYELLDGFRVRAGETVVDVGSNVGLFTVKAAVEAGAHGRVISVEPHPVAWDILRKNVEMNGLKNVTTVRAALGASKGEARLLFSPRSTVGTLYESFLHTPTRDAAAVPVMTLDSLASDVGLDRIDLLKIDVEGAEMEVLKGCERLLSMGAIGRVVVETHGEELARETVDFLEARGFISACLDVFPAIFLDHSFPTIFALRESSLD